MTEEQKDFRLYNLISNMNIAFGNKKGISVDSDNQLTDYGIQRLTSQLKNLYDENLELHRDGFKADLRNEIFDAIADISVFLYGASHFLNQPLRSFDIKLNEEVLLPYVNHDGNIEFKLFSSVEESRKHIWNNSFEIINIYIDDIFKTVSDKDLTAYQEKSEKLAELLFLIFELFKNQENHKHTMLYLNKKVNDSNLSKLCRNMEEVEDTLNFYRRKNVEVDFKESDLLQDDGKPFLIVYSTKDQIIQDMNTDGTLIFNSDGTPFMKEYRENKFLKNTKWFEPDLSEF